MKRLNCSFPDNIARKIEEYAKESGIAQSAVVSMAVKEYFDQKDMIKNLPMLIKLGEDLTKMEAHEAKKIIEEIGVEK